MNEMLRRERKYTAFWGVFLMASVALFFDKLTGAEFANLAWPIFGLYMGGNVGQTWSERRNA